ncbi:MAG: hypothetical protein WAW37_00780 [Syntrophobacteraceae bacterium]
MVFAVPSHSWPLGFADSVAFFTLQLIASLFVFGLIQINNIIVAFFFQRVILRFFMLNFEKIQERFSGNHGTSFLIYDLYRAVFVFIVRKEKSNLASFLIVKKNRKIELIQLKPINSPLVEANLAPAPNARLWLKGLPGLRKSNKRHFWQLPLLGR